MTDDINIKINLDSSAYTAGVARAQRSTESLVQSYARLGNDAAQYIGRFYRAMDRLDISTLAVTQSTKRVGEAQAAYTAAVNDFGQGSKKALDAHKDLIEAKDAQERAERRLLTSQAMVLADMGTLVARAPKTIAAIRGIAAAHTATAGAQAASTAAGVGSLAALGGVAAVVVAAAGAYKLYEFNVKQSTEAVMELNGVQKFIADNTPNIEGPAWLTKGFTGGAPLGTNFGKYRDSAIQEKQEAGFPYIAAAEDFFANEERKAKIAALHEPTIRAELEKTRLEMDKIAASMASPESVAAFEELKVKWQNLSKEATGYELSLKGIEAAQLNTQMSVLVSQTRSAFQGLGIDLSSFSVGFQEQMLANAGVSQSFIESLRPVVDVEKMLKNASGETGKALREQASITAHKDETTAQFHDRLIALGFAEEDIKARIDETGRALLAQAAATQMAAGATGGLTGSLGKVGGYNGALGNNPIATLLGLYKGDFLGELWNMPAGYDFSRWAMQYDPNGIASTLLSGENGVGKVGVGAYTGDVGSETRSKALQAIEKIVLKHTPSNQWDSLLRSIGTRGVANEKMVVIQPGAINVQGTKAEALLRELQRLGVR